MSREQWHWEDGECTKDCIFRLSPGFAWIVYPECDVAVATVSQDYAFYQDTLFHWTITDQNGVTVKGVAFSMDEAKKVVEAHLGVNTLPTFARSDWKK
jgi:hypothetical protein